MKRLFGLLTFVVLLTGCSNSPTPPIAKASIDRACAAWNQANGNRDFVLAAKYFTEAASIDSGYIDVSKSAQALKMVYVDQIDSGESIAKLTSHLENINAVCGI